MKKKIASVLLALSCLVTSGCSFLPIGKSSGLSILSTNINDAGELIITYSDGTMVNLGKVVGEKGDKGDTGAAGKNGTNGTNGTNGKDGVIDSVFITSVVINAQGHLVVTYSNGEVVDLGAFTGGGEDVGGGGEDVGGGGEDVGGGGEDVGGGGEDVGGGGEDVGGGGEDVGGGDEETNLGFTVGEKITATGVNATSGALESADTVFTVHYEVTAGKTYQVYNARNSAFLNASGEVVQVLKGSNMQSINYKVTAPDNAKYLRCCTYNNNELGFVELVIDEAIATNTKVENTGVNAAVGVVETQSGNYTIHFDKTTDTNTALAKGSTYKLEGAGTTAILDKDGAVLRIISAEDMTKNSYAVTILEDGAKYIRTSAATSVNVTCVVGEAPTVTLDASLGDEAEYTAGHNLDKKGALVVAADYFAVRYIKVEAGKTYKINGAIRALVLDANKNVLSSNLINMTSVSGDVTAKYTLKISNTSAAYICVFVRNNDLAPEDLKLEVVE